MTLKIELVTGTVIILSGNDDIDAIKKAMAYPGPMRVDLTDREGRACSVAGSAITAVMVTE